MIHSISAFLPLLRAGSAKKIVVISTGGAVPQLVLQADIANMCAYGATKAAAALATTKWALQLKGEGFVVVSLTPGLVDTTDTFGESGMFMFVLVDERMSGYCADYISSQAIRRQRQHCTRSLRVRRRLCWRPQNSP